jgi:type VI secretion system secreted protein VgrG
MLSSPPLDDILNRLVEKVENRFYGKYRGYVTNNRDPLGLGRIKAKVPRILEDQETVWCLPCTPYGGSFDMGFYMIPDEKSGVWIEFEGGDPSYPIWCGTWWGAPEHIGADDEFGQQVGKDIPKEVQSSTSSQLIKIIKTHSGNRIILDDSEGKESIIIQDKSEENLLKVDSSQNSVSINSKSKIVLKSDSIEIQAGGDLSIKAGNTITIKGSHVQIN